MYDCLIVSKKILCYDACIKYYCMAKFSTSGAGMHGKLAAYALSGRNR